MNCILEECDTRCKKNCNNCYGEGNSLYKHSLIIGGYKICCPICKREKIVDTDISLIQGDCEKCKYRKVK